MIDTHDATLIVLCSGQPDSAVAAALQSAATALEHPQGCYIASLDDVDDLELFIHEADPWSVVAIDDASIESLRSVFAGESASLAPDAPVVARGYTLVAVPGFADALGNQVAKRIAWERLRAARHPGIPW